MWNEVVMEERGSCICEEGLRKTIKPQTEAVTFGRFPVESRGSVPDCEVLT
jgi:hypothetical protein